VATAAGRFGEGLAATAAVHAACSLSPGAVFAVADCDTLGSDAQHGSVAAATADSVESAKGILVTVNGEGVSEVGDVDESASNFQTLSIEWASWAEESDVNTGLLGNGRVMPIDVIVEAQGPTVNRSVVSPPVSTSKASEELSSCNFDVFWI